MKIGYLMQEGVPDIRNRPLSGPANHVICVIQELERAGHQVRLLTKLDKQIYWSDDLENFMPVATGRLDQGLLMLMEKLVRRIEHQLSLPYANVYESLRFARACQQVIPDADVYFERMGWLGYGGGLAAQRLRIPLVLEVNGDHLDEFKSQGLKTLKSQYYLSHFLMKRAALRTSHVVATGEGWRRKYIERWKVAPSKVSIVESGSALVDILRREELRSFKPVKPGEPIRIAYCGGFEAWHGIPILVSAVRKAIDRGCSLRVILLGSGPEENRTIKLIQELELGGVFTLTDQVNIYELAKHLAQADIGVSPYCGRAEYSGLKLLDYKAAGLATIASGENNQPSVLKHQHTGWIVPPCDEDALTKAIITLAENPQLRLESARKPESKLKLSIAGDIRQSNCLKFSTAPGAVSLWPAFMFSVVIPVFNQKEYIRVAIESALGQSFRDHEIIVVDDGSTDGSKAIIDEFGSRARYIWQENQGLAGARNTGIRAAEGEFVALLDADDQWCPTYLEEMMSLASENPDAVAFYCMAQCMDADGHDLPQFVGGPPVEPAALYWKLLRADFLIPSTVTFRKMLVVEAGCFDASLRSCEDWDLWLRLLPTQKIVGSSRCLVRYRVHGSSLSTNVERMHDVTRKVIEKNFGPDDGKPSGWSPEKRRAYGGVYRYQVITLVQRQNNWNGCVLSLCKALEMDPSLAIDLDLFYELALGTQPFGYRGVSEFRGAEKNAVQLEKLIIDALDSPELASIRKQVFGTAFYALGLVSYSFGKRALSRSYFAKALHNRPELIFDARLTGDS